MSRLTVRLPESFHQLLTQQAKRGGVPLNHCNVHTLTRTVTATDIESQRQTFEEVAASRQPGLPSIPRLAQAGRLQPGIRAGSGPPAVR